MTNDMAWIDTDLSALIATIESGSRPKGGVSVDTGDVPSLGGENILQTGGISLEEVKTVPQAFYERMTKGWLKDGDVLINKDGANTGKVGLFSSHNDSPACINEHVFLLRGRTDKLTQEYLYYTLLSEHGQTTIRNRISGSAQPGLKTGFIKSFPLSLPKSTDEQAKITAVLATIDKAIEQTEVIIAKQARIKTGLMQDLLNRGIDEHGNIRSEATHKFKDSPLGRIPVEWVVQKMGKLTTKIVDGVHHTPTYVEDGIPFLTVSDLTAGYGISFAKVRYVSASDHRAFVRRADPKSGDVLVTKDGTLGVARVVPKEAPEFSIFVSVAQLRPDVDKATPELIASFFETSEFEAQLGKLSAGTGLRHIHLEHFRDFEVRTPPLDEQKQLFAILQVQRARIDEHVKGLKKLQGIRAGLMQDLLTGDVRVTGLLQKNIELTAGIA